MAEIENLDIIEKLSESSIDTDSVVDKLHTLGMRDMTKGMTADEKLSVVAVMNTEILVNEIKRREEDTNKVLKELTDYLATNYDKDMDVVQKQNVIKRVREIVKL